MHAGHEVRLLGIVHQVFQRQHHQGAYCGRRGRLRFIAPVMLPGEIRQGGHQGAQDQEIEPAACGGLARGTLRHFPVELDALRRQLERPGEYQRDREPDCQEQENQLAGPLGQRQHRHDHVGDLQDQPADDDVQDRNAIHVTPLEFGEKGHGRQFPQASPGPGLFSRPLAR